MITTRDITLLLREWRAGDARALATLVPLLHDELRRIARRCLRGKGSREPLQATELLNEAYLRFVDVREIDWQSRTHFLAMSARLMRRILVDLARARHAHKRGGDVIAISVDEATIPGSSVGSDVLRLNDALDALAALDERKSRVVELRYFAGLNAEETAAVLGVSSKTVLRDWEFARAWLQRELTPVPHYDA